ncbi:MATE family efflux transporter [Jatrophihabitans fulvus]
MTTPEPAPPTVPARRLLALSASAFVVLAAEPLYLLVDTAVVGHLGTGDLAGLGVGASLLTLLTVAGSFVAYGTTGRAARAFGAGRRDDAVREGVQASWLALGIGVAVAVAGHLVADPLTRVLAGSDDAARTAAQWFRIAVWGLPGVLLVLAGNGWMRGVQRTRAPVVVVLAANGLSAVLCPLLVYPAGLGLTGSAIANVTAQAVGAALFVAALVRTGVSLRPDRAVLRAQLVVGRDLIVRAMAFQVALLTAAGVASRMGQSRIAAHQIGWQLWSFTALLLDSVAIAAQSLVGAALGGSDRSFARTTAWQVARWGLAASLVFAVGYGTGAAVIPSLFTTSDAVVDQAHTLWPWFVAMLPLAGVVFALDGVLIGAGDVAYLRTLTIASMVAVFAPIDLAALHFGWGLGGVWAGLAASTLVRFAGMVWRVRGDRWLVTGAG